MYKSEERHKERKCMYVYEVKKREHTEARDIECVCVCVCTNTNPKVGGSKAVGGGHIGGGGCVGVEGIDIGQQGAHHCRNPGTHVLRRQTGKVPTKTSRG